MKLAAEILVPRGFEFSSATAGIKVSGRNWPPNFP